MSEHEPSVMRPSCENDERDSHLWGCPFGAASFSSAGPHGALTVFTSAATYPRGVRVLVVEDEIRMARLLKRGLEEEGHAVDIVGDGPEGLWMATENPYGAIVLDVMLPGIDGFEVCRQLRGKGVWAPILMLTARDEVGDRIRGLDAGADDYLVKPFSLLELAARLRALARRDDRSRPTIVSEGDLMLDPAAKRAWRGETELQLSPKEFALLELFLRHAGDVLTRSQIIDAVWDFAYDGTSNVVDQYVTYLRRKVDVPFGRHDIETVRGMGYRLRHETGQG
jgi:two-component system OmpR family response regulator